MDEARLVCDLIEGKGDSEQFMRRMALAVSPGFDPARDLERMGCANQTTMLSSESMGIAEAVREAMIHRYGEEETRARFRSFDTICSATQDRQDALHAMLRDEPPDLVIVIGGYNSSNTSNLVEIAIEKVPAYHIENATCIESSSRLRHQPLGAKSEITSASWLPRGPVTVGLTAGASTPNSEIDRVIRRVASFRDVVIP
jgi:4-hydroxy-3-methylbut-2-enyl diphosphate reductase